MILYLMRHGTAVNREDPAAPAEAERYLTPKGIEKTKAAARGLRVLGIQPDLMLASPYLRAVQTAEIVCAALDFPESKVRRTDALMPEAKPAALFEELAHVKAQEVMCFGHAPHMDEAIAFAVRASTSFTALKKSGAACLEMESLSPPRATLVWLLGPKTLRLLRKPKGKDV